MKSLLQSLVKRPSYRLGAPLILAALTLTACGGETTSPTESAITIPTRVGGAVETGGGETAAPTLVPTVTLPGGENEPNLEATPTLAPTSTPLPEKLPTPITDPPIQAVAGGQLPPTSRDLLFIADGAFKRWNHRTRQVEVLVVGPVNRLQSDENRFNLFPGDVTTFAVSADGKRAAVARLTSVQIIQQQSGESALEIPVTQHEILFLDLVSNEQWRIVTQADNLRSVQIAPDAARVSFVASGLSGGAVPNEMGDFDQTIYQLTTGGGSGPGQPTALRTCRLACFSPVWHIESNLLVWSDGEALWLQNTAASQPEILLPNKASPDFPADQVEIYSPLAWARNGRFLLTSKSRFEGGSYAVFDVPTKTVLEIPDSFVYVDPFPIQVMWMPDDRLFIIRNELNAGNLIQPTAELWRIHIEDGQLVNEESRQLTDSDAGAKGQMYLEDGRFAYALFNPSGAGPINGVYILTSLSQNPERVNAAPPPLDPFSAADVFWSGDGSGAIMRALDRAYYAPTSGEFLYDVTAVLGEDPHAFHWQPELIMP